MNALLLSNFLLLMGPVLSITVTGLPENQKDTGYAQKDDGSVFGFDQSNPSPEECQKYCHANCGKFHNAVSVEEDVTASLQITRRCILANEACPCGPQPDDFNPSDCHLFCRKDCKSFTDTVGIQILISRDLSEFAEAAYEAKQKAKKCEAHKPRCNCEKNSSRDSTHSYPRIFDFGDKLTSRTEPDVPGITTVHYATRRNARNSFYPGALIICMMISVLAAVMVTAIACRRQFRFRPESHYERNIGTISTVPREGLGFISIQLSGQPHPRVWSYDLGGGHQFITPLPSSEYLLNTQMPQPQPVPSVQPIASALPEYEPPPPYPGK